MELGILDSVARFFWRNPEIAIGLAALALLILVVQLFRRRLGSALLSLVTIVCLGSAYYLAAEIYTVDERASDYAGAPAEARLQRKAEYQSQEYVEAEITARKERLESELAAAQSGARSLGAEQERRIQAELGRLQTQAALPQPPRVQSGASEAPGGGFLSGTNRVFLADLSIILGILLPVLQLLLSWGRSRAS